MKSFKKYFKDVNKKIDPNNSSDIKNNIDIDQSIDSYKIITITDDTIEPFLLYGEKSNRQLNSGSLIRLLNLKAIDHDFLEQLLDISERKIEVKEEEEVKQSNNIHAWFRSLCICSDIFKESRIFYNFDPYNNFLLSKDSTFKDIRDIIEKTTSYTNSVNKISCKRFDFSRLINPYGLEKVVFTGGGTKGHLYIGVTIGLLTTGQIFYLNHYSGTSSGALSAMAMGCITPDKHTYMDIKKLSLKEIMINRNLLVKQYQKAVSFTTSRFCARDIDTFYEKPCFTYYGLWTIASKIMQKNGLYDPVKSGFQVWYGLICLRICQIMNNGLDTKIIIKDENGLIIQFMEESDIKSTSNDDSKINKTSKLNRTIKESDIDTLSFIGWTIEKFFTFSDYHEFTDKTIVFTGTKTDPIETVYYTHTDKTYSDKEVILGATASMSIPWIFEAPIINGSYHMDGGLFENYPLTHIDITVKGKIKYYNNKIFGYLIDDNNSIIDAYEVIKELWLVYIGFLQIMNIGYLVDVPNFNEISRVFFEIRAEIYKILYFADAEIETFVDSTIIDQLDKENKSYNINGLNDVLNILNKDMNESCYLNFKFAKKDINYIIKSLQDLKGFKYITNNKSNSKFKIGKKTDLTDIMNLAFEQGVIYNELSSLIKYDLEEIDKLTLTLDDDKLKIVKRYEKILNHLMRDILSYYEVKGTFIRNNDLEQPCEYFVNLLKKLNHNLVKFDKLTKDGVELINTNNKSNKTKNYIQTSIDIGLMMISKIVMRGTSNYDIKEIKSSQTDTSSYRKVIDYFFHTDMTGMLYKYSCMANDRICNDIFNQMRTIKLNAFETSTLQFDITPDLKSRLIYEGYSKTIKYFVNILRIMEMTNRHRSTDEYIPSYEIRFKKLNC
jgi:hypothetical protein